MESPEDSLAEAALSLSSIRNFASPVLPISVVRRRWQKLGRWVDVAVVGRVSCNIKLRGCEAWPGGERVCLGSNFVLRHCREQCACVATSRRRLSRSMLCPLCCFERWVALLCVCLSGPALPGRPRSAEGRHTFSDCFEWHSLYDNV